MKLIYSLGLLPILTEALKNYKTNDMELLYCTALDTITELCSNNGEYQIESLKSYDIFDYSEKSARNETLCDPISSTYEVFSQVIIIITVTLFYMILNSEKVVGKAARAIGAMCSNNSIIMLFINCIIHSQ
jgi:hypothetical protein